MKRTLLFALAMVFAGLSFTHQGFAQQYKWTDKNGKTQYGDTPPAGVKATPLKTPGGPAAAPAPSPAAKDAKGAPAPKGPLTPAQQDADFRKRQQDAEKSREKEAKAAENAQAKRENCSNATEQLRSLETGQRIAKTDAKGERYYLDDEQRAADLAKARKNAQDWCS